MNDNDVWPNYAKLMFDYADTVKGISDTIRFRYKCIYYNDMAYYYVYKGEVGRGIESYYKSLKIAEENGWKMQIAQSYNNLGSIYDDLGEVERAIEFHRKALFIRLQHNELESIATSFNNLGYCFEKKGEADSALAYFYKTLEIDRKSGINTQTSTTYNNIGALYLSLGQLDSSKHYLLLAYSIRERTGDKQQISTTSAVLARLYLDLNLLDSAFYFGKLSNENALATGYPSTIASSSLSLSVIYEKKGRYDLALDYYKTSILLRDSIFGLESKQKSLQLNAKYSYEKKATADSVKQEEQEKVNAAVLAKEKAKSRQKEVENISLYAGLGLVAIFTIFIFSRFRVAKKQKAIIEEQKVQVDKAYCQLEEKNTEIMDSIGYAKRIQAAILPPIKLVKEYLQESFILYKPKDVVAGDFYWMENKNNKILFAAADCTGHGVPGAMVSVICNNGLNRSVREYGLTDPGKILDKTREVVIQEFEKSEEEVKDGMDIALCSLEGTILKYAGANNPLWIIRNGEILETKANKQPIGKYTEPKPFTTHTINLIKGDSIFIFSDGFVDQFGGERGKKYKPANLRKLLLSCHDQPMEKQKKMLEEAFETWRGNLEQIDDVCIIGVRI